MTLNWSYVVVVVFGLGLCSALEYVPDLDSGQLSSRQYYEEMTGRQGMASWTEPNFHFAFGGRTEAINTTYHADLWRYDRSNRTWRWIQGKRNENTFQMDWPPSRCCAMTWTVYNSTFQRYKHFMFGGRGIALDGTIGLLNDFWEFFPSNASFLYLGGSNTTYEPSFFTYRDQYPSPIHLLRPGARENAIAWIEDQRYLYLYGGLGCESNCTDALEILAGCSTPCTQIEPLGDLWRFDSYGYPGHSMFGRYEWQYIRGYKSHGDPREHGHAIDAPQSMLT